MWAILGGLVVGAGMGVYAQSEWGGRSELKWTIDNITAPIGKVFLRLILMTVIPIILVALPLGIGSIRDITRLGRIGLKTLLFTLVISSLAVGIGVGLVNLIKPGVGMTEAAQTALKKQYGSKAAADNVERAKKTKSAGEIIVDLVPQNVVEEAARANEKDYQGGGILGVMVFALFFGIGLALVPNEKAAPVIGLLEGLFEVLMMVISIAMWLAPLGVAALVFNATAQVGADLLSYLGKYVVVVVLGLAIHQFGVYSILLAWLVRANPLVWFGRIREVMLMAFSTASSNVTLPTSLRVAEENLGIPRHVNNFVLTVGATANQNGSALFEGVTILFLAQLLGIDLSLGQQLQVVFMSVLAGIGTAGVPGGSIPMIVIVMQSVGVPGEAIGMILGVNNILDMCRTTVNVTGDLVVASYVSRSEGHPLRLADA